MRVFSSFGSSALALAVSLSAFTPLVAVVHAQDSGTNASSPAPLAYPFVGEITGDNVSLRAGFNENYLKLKRLEPGEKVVVLGEQAGWYQVLVPSTFTGWVSRQFIQLEEDGHGAISGNRVSLRPSASTKHLPVGYVNTGDKLWVVDAQEEWVQVVAPSQMPAWVHARFVKPNGPADAHREEIAKIEEAALLGWREKRGEAEKNRAAKDAQSALAAKFDDAESRLKAESQKPVPDVAPLIPIYEEVAKDASDPLLQQGARFRLDQLKNQDGFNKKIQESRDIIADLERELKQNEERYLANLEKMRQSVEKKEPDGRHVGWVSSVFTLDLSKGFPAFALTKGGSNLLYLESTKYQLKDFVGKHVIVSGDVKERKGLDLSILVVRSIEIVADGT